MDYRLKYIKYKLKYLDLKGAGGDKKKLQNDEDDVDKDNIYRPPSKKQKKYVITNYYNEEYIRAIAEVIPFDLLEDKMSNHGLGSGIYGFIDEKKAGVYVHDTQKPKKIIIDNPLILKDNTIRVDGEYESDNTRYSAISNILNRTCTKIIKENVDGLSIEYIKSILEKDNFYLVLNISNFKITDIFTPTLDNLINAIKNFIIDYKMLLSLPKEEENYVYMPINYLLHLYGYDGIYNIGGDSGSLGSIKFFFDCSYPSRGYRQDYKKRDPLKGHLIFNSKKISEKRMF